MQHVGQEQARRAAADDRDLRALLHECLFPPEAEIAYCHPRARRGSSDAAPDLQLAFTSGPPLSRG